MASGVVRWNIGPLMTSTAERLIARIETAAGLVEARAKASMKGGGKPHRPSAPGTPPHVDTGALRSSGQHSVISDGYRVRGYVMFGGGNVPYASVHEFGGRRHPPRPYLRPALEASRADILRIIRGGQS